MLSSHDGDENEQLVPVPQRGSFRLLQPHQAGVDEEAVRVSGLEAFAAEDGPEAGVFCLQVAQHIGHGDRSLIPLQLQRALSHLPPQRSPQFHADLHRFLDLLARLAFSLSPF